MRLICSPWPLNFNDQTFFVVPDPCLPNPCLNGGTCNLDADRNAVCTCTPQYTDPTCGTFIGKNIQLLQHRKNFYTEIQLTHVIGL